MKINIYPLRGLKNFSLPLLCGFILLSVISAFSQTSSPEFPIAVSTNEISGSIPARDLGDSRLTTIYYTFNGTQGDIFINIAASNFSGDIDVFAAEGLRPISKISFYGDPSLTETGRVVYLRKSEKLILRVQGRTPDDNPASYRIKFAGSFVAAEDNGEQKQLELPTLKTDENTGIRVNSVGTIIETKPKVEEKETAAEKAPETPKTSDESVNQETPKEIVTDEPVAKQAETEVKENPKEVSGNPEKESIETPAKTKTAARNSGRKSTRRTPAKTPAKSAKAVEETADEKTEAANKAVNPLENVKLVVLMKNGDKIEFPMPDVFRFSLNNGILTIITKDGKIHRRPIVEVQKMTIE